MEDYRKPMVDYRKEEGSCTYKFSEAIKACIRCVGDQAGQNASIEIRCGHGLLPQMSCCWSLTVVWTRRACFLQGCVLREATHSPVDVLIHKHILTAPSGPGGSFQRKHIKPVEDQREELEGMALTKALHICMKVFNNISLKIESSKNQGNFYMVRNRGRKCIQCVHVGKKDTDQVTSASLSFGV